MLSAGFRNAGCWRTGHGDHRPTWIMHGNTRSSKKNSIVRNKKNKQKKEFQDFRLRTLSVKRRRLPTLPHCIAVPSAQVGLTSLFGMGRGGTPPP